MNFFVSLFSVFHFSFILFIQKKTFLTLKTVCCSLVFNCLSIVSTPIASQSYTPKAFWVPLCIKPYFCLLNVQETVAWNGDSFNKYLLSICSCIFRGQSCPPPLEISVHVLAQASHESLPCPASGLGSTSFQKELHEMARLMQRDFLPESLTIPSMTLSG